MEEKKKTCIEQKITPEIFSQMKEKCRQMPGVTHRERAKQLVVDYPQFSTSTLCRYSAIAVLVKDDVFQLYLDGKLSLGVIDEFRVIDPKTQTYLAEECVKKKITPTQLSIIKKLVKEGDAWEVAIGRALGEIKDSEKKEQRKSLDQILTQLADMGNRWQAMVSMSLELVGKEEAEAGVHHAIFQKVYILRQVVGNQYDFINSKCQRYMNLIKKRMKDGASAQEGMMDETGERGEPGVVEVDGVVGNESKD